MILHNTAIAGREGNWHIHIQQGKIISVASAEDKPGPGEKINLENGICLPGLINSHDHLEFNLFPQLRDKIYTNYGEWGPSIQLIHKEQIDRVKKIPLTLRIKWGIYKNLLNGFTTVVNHGKNLAITDEPIDVFQDYFPLHSPGFEKNWKWKLNNPFKTGKPFVMHLGEGTDDAAKNEIDRVINSNFFRKPLIAVHGVAMKPGQAGHFRGLVWCPDSNYFLLDQTADVAGLKSRIKIVFGTDSTLTASWNAWDHFCLALKKQLTESKELLNMLGPAPALLWKLNDRGEIKQGLKADILVIKKTPELFRSGPADILLLVKNGEIRLLDEEIQDQVKIPSAAGGLPQAMQMKTFTKIKLGNSIKIVEGDLRGLTRDILEIYPEAKIPFKLVNE